MRLKKTLPVLFSALGFAGTGAMIVGYSCLYTVDGGERAVIYDLRGGIQNHVIGEGTHFYVPVKQRPILRSIRTQYRTVSTSTGTADLQQVSIKLRVLYQPVVEALPWILSNHGHDYESKILPSLAQETLKSVVARYNAEELITKRADVSIAVQEVMRARLEDMKLNLIDASITHLDFTEEFTRAVERKQVAYQVSEKHKWIVKRDERYKEAMIIRAEGETESARLIAEAIKIAGDGMIKLRKLEAAKDIAMNLAQSRNVVYLPSNTNMLIQAPDTSKQVIARR